MRVRHLLPLVVVAIAVACGTQTAGAPDAGEADAGEPPELLDACACADLDASSPDAGPTTPDAGPQEGFDAGSPADAGGDDVPDAGLSPFAACFAELADPDPTQPSNGPDYDQFEPVIGSHCWGSDHQEITGIERVVFVGDSVTVGTPPTLGSDFYRSRLADRLVAKFGLDAPDLWWKNADLVKGTAAVDPLRIGSQTMDGADGIGVRSGDFASCAKWGARTDDLRRTSPTSRAKQLDVCFPAAERGKRTLVIMTMGGNDIAALTQDGAHAPYDQSRAQTEQFVRLLREAIEWIKAPGRFPNGVFVVFGNMFEFTDGTGEVGACTAAGVSGLEEWDHPEWQAELVIWANEQFMKIAKDTGTDMIFMLEHFCGHGFNNADPANRCYRGPNTPRWFDDTCIHPNPTGHDVIAEMFMSVVNE